MRTTKHRQEILDTLAVCHGTLSAQEVHTRLPHINLATIYRNLEAFSEVGIIKKMYLASGKAQYEYQKTPHHHAVCDTCDKVIHFTIPPQDLKKVVQVPGFAIDNVELVVHGSCTHAHSTKVAHHHPKAK